MIAALHPLNRTTAGGFPLDLWPLPAVGLPSLTILNVGSVYRTSLRSIREQLVALTIVVPILQTQANLVWSVVEPVRSITEQGLVTILSQWPT